jgi:hypothetical protein
MTDVRLDIKEDGKGLLKFEWRTVVADEEAYHIEAEDLLTVSNLARQCLQDLITVAMTRAPETPLVVGLQLKRLAEAGAKLREQIFFAVAGEEEKADSVQRWFGSQTDTTLHISIDRRIYVPWGLAFDGDPEELPHDPNDISIGKFSGFWALKYRVSTLYNRIRDSIVSNPRRSTEAKVIKLVNRGAWTQASSKLSEPEKSLVQQIFTAGEICSSKEFERIWKKEKRSLETDLLYFFGHASGTDLEFDKTDLLRMKEFPKILRRDPPRNRPACMVFLNGCHTAIGDDERGGFLEATGYLGFCGFVGTEAKIPDVFALRFANAFLTQMLYTGLKASEVMNKLREEHWPLSLVYNLSCHPEFRFDPTGALEPEVPRLGNLSQGLLGSATV